MHLTAAEWARIEALFPIASGLPAGERASFLERECGTEPRVRGELEAMLAAAASADPLLDAQVALTSTGPKADAERLAPGTRLGSWRIKSLIGTGGMGEVYLAERADGAYAMSAAIKLLKRELYSFNNAQRFLRERRVLGRLSHPNIARALDAGTTDDGRPFLVMEYVTGDRITDHARARELAPRESARLMLAVAEAVAESHRQGVVHRDLKPANVMVTPDGQVKLLDFGIARLMDESDATPGVLPMTPAYAAPEQILNRDPTPATDVYALGVMLYQLLTHRLPHLREGMPLPVIAAGLRDETAERPSRVVLGTQGLFSDAARRRQAQAIAGDLDWIALKALQPDAAQRYPTAGELADDLRRFLEHLPVRARQDSLSYRASRFMRRYPTQVAAGAVATLALVAGLLLAMWQARSARIEATRAERIKDFVLSVFQEQDPAARATTEARSPAELLERSLDRADTELRADPALQAEVLGDLGELQRALGDVAAARATLERALQGARAEHGSRSLPVAVALRRLARALEQQGEYAEAERLALEARDILKARGAAGSPEAARVELQLGFLRNLGKAHDGSAVKHFHAAQRLFEKTLGPDAPETTYAMYLRGQSLEQARLDDEALAVLRDAEARITRAAGPGSARLLPVLMREAEIRERAGAYAEAEALYRRAVDLQRRHYGERHARLADLLRNWGELEQSQQRYAEAEARFREAEAALPADAVVERGDLLKDRGQMLLEAGRAAEAERDLAEAAELVRRTQGETSGLTWFVRSEWGRALAALGQLERAEKIQREALARLGAILGEKSYRVSLITDGLADTLRRRGRHGEAVELRRRSLALSEATYAPAHRLNAVRRVNLAAALVDLGGADREAAILLDRAIADLDAAGSDAGKLQQARTLRQGLPRP